MWRDEERLHGLSRAGEGRIEKVAEKGVTEMPRLDNSDPKNLEILREWGERRWQHIEFDPNDPGDMPPMDVCWSCHRRYFPHDGGMVAHPLYDGEGYTCTCCQAELTSDDDDPPLSF